MRLNKFLAHAAGLSRRQADQAIAAGRVALNGQPVAIGQDIDPTSDRITLDGQAVTLPRQFTVIALNKPVGYVCSRRAQARGVKTVYELLPVQYHCLKTIGRLDKDSSGLILLTDDGDLAYRLTHPKFAKAKEYIAKLDRPLAPLHQQMISDFGLTLDDGPSQLSLESMNSDRTEFRIIMHEGRNRQIRRTFAALGYQVISLERLSFGSYQLGSLAVGQWRTEAPSVHNPH